MSCKRLRLSRPGAFNVSFVASPPRVRTRDTRRAQRYGELLPEYRWEWLAKAMLGTNTTKQKEHEVAWTCAPVEGTRINTADTPTRTVVEREHWRRTTWTYSS